MSRDMSTTCLRHVRHVLCRDIFSETGDILNKDITDIDEPYAVFVVRSAGTALLVQSNTVTDDNDMGRRIGT